MSNTFRKAPASGAADERGILAHVGVLIVLLAFALLAYAHLSNATESGLVPATAPTEGKKWVNHDDIPHLVAEKALAFKSQALDTNDSFSFTFTKPGDVEYFCVLHPHMIGKIIVKAGGA